MVGHVTCEAALRAAVVMWMMMTMMWERKSFRVCPGEAPNTVGNRFYICTYKYIIQIILHSMKEPKSAQADKSLPYSKITYVKDENSRQNSVDFVC